MGEKKVDSEWFKSRIAARNTTQTAIAERLEVDKSSFSRMLSGEISVSLEKAAQIAAALGVSLEEVCARMNVPLPAAPSSVKVVGVVRGDGTLSKARGGFVPALARAPDSCVAVRDEDPASMFYGHAFYFEPASTVRPEAIGRLSVVARADEVEMLAALRPGTKASHYDLVAINGTIIRNCRIRSATPVFGSRAP